jgi:hypothetical protein
VRKWSVASGLAALLVIAACSAPAGPVLEPPLGARSSSEIRKLIDGIWKLQKIDGHEATGWASFNGDKIWFTADCNTSHGTFVLSGDIVTVQAPYSTSMECDNLGRRPGPPSLAPSFMWDSFRVRVDEDTLVLSSRAPKIKNQRAQYTRSSEAAMYNAWRKR